MKKILILLLIISLLVLGLFKFAEDNPRNPTVRKMRKWITTTRENRHEFYDNKKEQIHDFFIAPEIIFTGTIINITGQKLYNQGTIALKSGNYEVALQYFDDAILADSGQASYRNNRAVSLSQLQKSDEALLNYEKVLQLDPLRANAWINKGKISFNHKNYVQAILDFRKAIKLEPNDVDTHFILAKTYFFTNNIPQAIQSYSRVTELQSGNFQAWYQLGLSYEKKENYNWATTAFIQCTILNPKFFDAWYHLGTDYYRLWNHLRALKSLNTALILNPTHTGVLKTIGKINYELKQYKLSLKYFTLYLQIHPDDAEVWAHQWNAYYELENLMQAYLSYSRSLGLDGNNKVVRENKLKTEMQLQKD